MWYKTKKAIPAIRIGDRPDGRPLYRCPWCGGVITGGGEECGICKNPVDFDKAVMLNPQPIPRQCAQCFHWAVCSAYMTPYSSCEKWDGWHSIKQNPQDTPQATSTVVLLTGLNRVYLATMGADGTFIVPDAKNGVEGEIERWRYI